MTFTSLSSATALVLLSDLPTPSFIVDIQALRRVVIEPSMPDTDSPRHINEINIISTFSSDSTEIPSMRLPKYGLTLHPIKPVQINIHSVSKDGTACPSATKAETEKNSYINTSVMDVDFPIIEGQPSIGYIHSTVIRAREDAIEGRDDPISTFLAEIDLDPSLCSNSATLVLGLNNHHVGSYYWARSAGAGSSMEAPGVWFGHGSRNTDSCESENKVKSRCSRGGILRWLDDGGPTLCNSNDGKRSEWVNFLRKGDTVQLVPTDGQDAIMQFVKRYCEKMIDRIVPMKDMNDSGNDSSSIRFFGISSEGRPLGSEPVVVCEWRC
mmetsp:Transcript_16371/g.33613  ORF Transcript_16371/g.33613 Transcript_16371/m.33613 type:complete len:325 (-) Transcript_16371:231-1205(-)